MIFKDYYKILNLETNKVSIEQIKNAFREQAKKYHPDVSNGKIAEERFKDINEAYRILSNSASKRKYDRIWYSHVGKKIEKEKEKEEREARPDILTLLFGSFQSIKKQHQEKKEPVKGENVETEVTLSIEQAFYGVDEKISLRTVDGKMKTFSIKVPAGIQNGEKMRLIGQGKAGINGGKNGDLLVKINIANNKQYHLHGYDIYTNLYLMPWQAALGTRVKVKTIEDEMSVYIPQGIGSGEKLRIPKKGYKDGKGGRGDLIAEIKIILPKKLTQEEIEIYKKLKEIEIIEPTNETLNIK